MIVKCDIFSVSEPATRVTSPVIEVRNKLNEDLEVVKLLKGNHPLNQANQGVRHLLM